ncbi:hypothetical protein ACHRV1_10930 [Flavobacterium aquidurense]|uniref:hypothetical protein n=1 Tax=Flavobacterium aquidurense TaxID=362413 RepID=UPI0037566B5F
MNIESKLLEKNDLLQENQLLEKFHVEELEKRYEFKWVDQVKTGLTMMVLAHQ